MGDLPDKEKNFFEWYNEVLERANITDKRYPVKGMNVWTPFGYKAISLQDRIIREKVEPLGYQEVSFPTLIPETEFRKEGEHIKGFDDQVYWVTRAGKTVLDVQLALRPTSETAIYPMFALWVRSHRDLPLRVFQIVTVFRYETKTTRPLMRVREIHFFEGHTVQLDEEAAETQVKADIASFREIADVLCLPFLCNRRPDWDKFAGAYYSMAFDLPLGGAKTLQIGSVHHYKDNFAKVYGIGFEDRDGAQRVPNQTTYGLSERLLGAVVAIHGDMKGVVWPSAIAPVQVVIIPIPAGGALDEVQPQAESVLQALTGAGIRAVLDASPERPGAKYYSWELKGVPLRIEVGKRELAEGVVSAVTRLGERTKIHTSAIVEGVRNALKDHDKSLRVRAEGTLRKVVKVIPKKQDLDPEAVNVIGWCGADACGKEVEKVPDLSLLGASDPSGFTVEGTTADPVCLFCGNRDGARWAVAARPI